MDREKERGFCKLARFSAEELHNWPLAVGVVKLLDLLVLMALQSSLKLS